MTYRKRTPQVDAHQFIYPVQINGIDYMPGDWAVFLHDGTIQKKTASEFFSEYENDEQADLIYTLPRPQTIYTGTTKTSAIGHWRETP